MVEMIRYVFLLLSWTFSFVVSVSKLFLGSITNITGTIYEIKYFSLDQDIEYVSLTSSDLFGDVIPVYYLLSILLAFILIFLLVIFLFL